MIAELAEFSALWILIAAAIGLLLADAFARAREPGFLRGVALLAVAVAFAFTWAQLGEPDYDLGHFAFAEFLLVDHLTVACDLLALLALAGVIACADGARNRTAGDAPAVPPGSRRGPPISPLHASHAWGPASDAPSRGFGEREPLLLLAGAGALACIHAGDLLTVWLGVELLAIAAVLIAFASADAVANPSKRAALLIQLIPGAIASCLMLFGIALIYAALGSTSLDGFGQAATSAFTLWGGVQRWVTLVNQYATELAAQDPSALEQARAEIIRGLAPAAMLLPGLLFTLLGLLSKLGLLPFARRRESVEQAPLHVSALWSTLAVVALTAVLLRVYVGALHSPRLVNEPYGWTGALPFIALLTGGWAALAATRQRRLSRVVALLALTQLSLLVLGLVAAASFHGHVGVGARHIAPEHEVLWARLAGDEAYAAVLIQLSAHVIAALGCYAALAASGAVRLQHWTGMAARRPALTLAFAICLLSLVGLPPLAGFLGKLGIMRAIVEHSAMRWMLIVVIAELAICAWVVLRVIAAMLSGDDPISEPGERREPSPWATQTTYAAAMLSLLLGLGGQQLVVFARLPAAGGAFEPGDSGRLEWLEQRRASWAIEDARFAEGPESDVEAEISDEDEPIQSVDPSL